jgi:Spy/CpxP family protein refolding chaperone
MYTRRKLFICIALSLIVFAAQPALAQGFKWWQMERFQKELVLTPEQITRLEGIFQTTEPMLRAQKTALDRREDKLSKVVADPKSDEPAVLLATDRLDAARNELNRTRTLMLFRMRRVLSDEQNVKMKELHEHDRRDRDRNRQPKSEKPGGDKPKGELSDGLNCH